MAKMGRPKADSPKEKNVSIRVTVPEYEEIKEYASKHNLTMTQVVLNGVRLLYKKEDTVKK